MSPIWSHLGPFGCHLACFGRQGGTKGALYHDTAVFGLLGVCVLDALWLSGDPESRFWVPLGAFWAPFECFFNPFCMFWSTKRAPKNCVCFSVLFSFQFGCHLAAFWSHLGPFGCHLHFCDTWTAVTCVLLMSARLGPGILGVWSCHLVMVV